MQDAHDQDTSFVELVEHDVRALLGAPVARTDVATCPAMQHRPFGQPVKASVQRCQIPGRLVLIPAVSGVDTDSVKIGLSGF